MARMLWVTCSRCALRRWCSWRAACHVLCEPAPGLRSPLGGGLGRACAGASSASCEVLLHPLEPSLAPRWPPWRPPAAWWPWEPQTALTQFMLHMEEVRRVMRPEVMFHIRQQARRFIAGRLDHLTVETRKRLLHQRMPRVLIAAVGRLLQDNVVALGFHRHQAQPAGKRFILANGDVFGGHVCAPNVRFPLGGTPRSPPPPDG